MQEHRAEASTKLGFSWQRQSQEEPQENVPIDLYGIRTFFQDCGPKDLVLATKFYFTGKQFPNDVECWSFPLLYLDVKNKLKISSEAVRKKLERMVGVGILTKTGTSPKTYNPQTNGNMIQIIKDLIRQSADSGGMKEAVNNIF